VCDQKHLCLLCNAFTTLFTLIWNIHLLRQDLAIYEQSVEHVYSTAVEFIVTEMPTLMHCLKVKENFESEKDFKNYSPFWKYI